jgi:hypothetical protein
MREPIDGPKKSGGEDDDARQPHRLVMRYLTEEDLQRLSTIEFSNEHEWNYHVWLLGTQRKIEQIQAEAAREQAHQESLALARRSIAIYHSEREARQRSRKLRHDREYQSERRAEKAKAPPDPLIAIDREYQLRLKRLRFVFRQRWRDKRIEQLRGREWEISLFWKAMQIARLKRRSGVSDTVLAAEFTALTSRPEPLTRHQARSFRKLVAQLDSHPFIWGRIGEKGKGMYGSRPA